MESRCLDVIGREPESEVLITACDIVLNQRGAGEALGRIRRPSRAAGAHMLGTGRGFVQRQPGQAGS